MNIPSDKIKHFVACTIVAFITASVESVCGAELQYSWLAGFVAGMAIGVGKEYGDLCAHDKWDWTDIGADAVGAIVGATIGSIVSLL